MKVLMVNWNVCAQADIASGSSLHNYKGKMTIEELQLYLQREIEEENKILSRAEVIRQEQAKGKMAPSAEPKRPKVHWDYLLDEMSWLAKEFQKERRWKIQGAKRIATAAQRSNLDLESRVFLKVKEEEKAIKKRAAWIAKEVMGLWTKAHKVVAFKVRNEVDAKKKEVLDKQLDVLLGQTQRYSSLLAKRLKSDETNRTNMRTESEQGGQNSTARGAVNQPVSEGSTKGTARSSTSISVKLEDTEDSIEYRSGEDDDADDEATLEQEERLAAAELGSNLQQEQMDETKGLAEDADLPLEQLLARYGYVIPNEPINIPSGEEPKVKNEELELLVEGPSNSMLAQEFMADPVDDQMDEEEYKSGEDDDMDDEGTLEEEERLAVKEFGVNFSKQQEEETAGLQQDADLPLDQLLARYGYVMPNNMDKENNARPSLLAKEFSSTPQETDVAEEEEYRSGEDDDADDEATLEEEERIAVAELGMNYKKQQEEETNGLQEDADLPLEELLARYGYRKDANDHPKDVAQENIEADDIESEEGMEGTLEAMAAAQPTGYTLATTKVKTPVPFLLKGELREYQHIGLDWLVTLYHKHLNGILADEMGLGKTIQTIALLSWLACERGDWGPHLIIVPTSVMLNWEMEFKRWCPAFKLLTYYGNPKERAAKRQGWSKPNAFHVCITSYTLVLQDARMFRRKKWKYLILDEAHMIKNWKSQRWQTLLNFNSKRRLLITGTPLQNDLMELWSLMHFLMPQVFASHAQFKDWFSNPLTGMVEGSAEYNKAIIQRLHAVLRPFLLRRLKKDVEKQLPGKHEHVIKCRLSKRQRQLYEEYVAQSETKQVLASGNFLGIMNCLMQLRKVCNHPDLFEGRPIVSSFDMDPISIVFPTVLIREQLMPAQIELLQLDTARDMDSWEADVHDLMEPRTVFEDPSFSVEDELATLLGAPKFSLLGSLGRTPSQHSLAAVTKFLSDLADGRREWRKERRKKIGEISLTRSQYSPALFGGSLQRILHVPLRLQTIHETAGKPKLFPELSQCLLDSVKLPEQRSIEMEEIMKTFVFAIPKARTMIPQLQCSIPKKDEVSEAIMRSRYLWDDLSKSTDLLHVSRIRSQLFFPDKRLIQYDCGKLQELARLLAKLKAGDHRALIFTQMSKMLDILESFLNIHGYTYVRLDGATKPEARQTLMQRFNTDTKIFCFILSTRSGGVGMNLTGADSVIFYDSDWNPAMDAQVCISFLRFPKLIHMVVLLFSCLSRCLTR